MAPEKGEKKMLEQLVESKNNSNGGARRGKFLLTTFALVCVLFLNGILWSLFAQDLAMTGELDLSKIVAPVALPETAPPPPEPIVDRPQNPKPEAMTTRQTNLARVDEPQIIPEQVSAVGSTQKARPTGAFKISDGPEVDQSGSPTENRDKGGEGVGGIKSNATTQIVDEDKDTPPPVKQPKKEPEPAPKPPARPISKGVINGQAINLPRPAYPAAAKAMHASGDVSVQVTIDESGNVISANAVSGHPLLKQVSEVAARSAKFKPTYLSEQPVKVTGLIVYKFIP